jgi:hypothetical protein
MNYFNLPIFFKDFLIKQDNLVELIPITKSHPWIDYPVNKFINPEGIAWFTNHNIILKSALLFRAHANIIGPAHIDGLPNKPTNYGFNFVLEGHGEMQWLDVEKIEITSYTTLHNIKHTYAKSASDSNITVLDSWSGNAGIVKINTFHRIVTSDVDRVCLSVRPSLPISFEEAVNIIKAI